jgi:hypothetical protein
MLLGHVAFNIRRVFTKDMEVPLAGLRSNVEIDCKYSFAMREKYVVCFTGSDFIRYHCFLVHPYSIPVTVYHITYRYRG